jgi:hypothetical protein
MGVRSAYVHPSMGQKYTSLYVAHDDINPRRVSIRHEGEDGLGQKCNLILWSHVAYLVFWMM